MNLEKTLQNTKLEPTFENFLKKVDQIITLLTGLGYSDFNDAPWHELFITNPKANDKDIINLLSSYDDLFANAAQIISPN